jgi:propanediol dehydratase large subunit
MKELREFIRYSIESGSHPSAFVEIEGVPELRGIISDLSTGGFSFAVDINKDADSILNLEKFLFIRINFDKFTISAEVEKKWSLIKNADDSHVYTAGVSFKVISNEDRLRLNEIIEYLRSESSAYHRKTHK